MVLRQAQHLWDGGFVDPITIGEDMNGDSLKLWTTFNLQHPTNPFQVVETSVSSNLAAYIISTQLANSNKNNWNGVTWSDGNNIDLNNIDIAAVEVELEDYNRRRNVIE